MELEFWHIVRGRVFDTFFIHTMKLPRLEFGLILKTDRAENKNFPSISRIYAYPKLYFSLIFTLSPSDSALFSTCIQLNVSHPILWRSEHLHATRKSVNIY